MKVMHILNTGAYSGAENVVISIITHTRNDVESIYVSPKGTIESVLNENGIRYYPVNKLSVHSISKAIRRENPNIIHAHDFTASVLVSLCKTGIPIISHLHNNPPWIKK